jgi:hypothetical protein
VIADPPSLAGAVNEIEILVFSGVTLTMVGALGTVYGINGVAEITFEAEESPNELVATMYTLYDVPFVKLEIVKGEVVVDAFCNAPPFNEYL